MSAMTVSERLVFLQEHTPLGVLSPSTLGQIARCLKVITLPTGQFVVEADQPPEGLYLLRQGKLETLETGLGGVSFLPGSVLNLEALLLNQPVEQSIHTLTESTLWVLEREQFQHLVQDYPDILQTFTRQLVEAVRRLSFQFSYEQERQAILRPYLVTRAKRGVVGRSRYADRLRGQIREAAADRQLVLIFGEPGLEKDNLAALVHYGSSQRCTPMMQVDCGQLQASGADLFGRSGGKPGLLVALEEGTLVLSNPGELEPDLRESVARLMQTGQYQPVSRDRETVPVQTSNARIILISEQPVAELDSLVAHRIKVPPLRVRKANINDWVNYYLALWCQRRRQTRLTLAPEALRRLQAYDFPNNLRELQSLVERAASQRVSGNTITEELIWPNQGKKRLLRLNLLNRYPALRRFLRSSWWPDRINYGFTLALFAVVVGVLFLGRLVYVRPLCADFDLGGSLGLGGHCLPLRLPAAADYRWGDDLLRPV